MRSIRSGELVYGTCITAHHPLWPAAMQQAGLDFVFIDTEHIPISRNELAHMCQANRGRHISPLVRVTRPDHYLACQAIDAGAVGVVAPYIESVEEIRVLVGATKYRPLKGRKLSGILSGEEAIDPKLKTYIDRYNQGNICIANIESVPALDKLDELLSIEGLDAVFIGPHDLSVSMGIPEDYDHPDFQTAVKQIIRTCKKNSLGVGIHFSEGPERQQKWVKEGANIVIHSSDFALIGRTLISDINVIKSVHAGEKPQDRGSFGTIV
nr:aldolase/citrate lyase family protein [Cyclobacterium lianum]